MKKFFALVIALVVVLSASSSFAAEKLIEATGEYVMDSRLDETPASATARAREEAQRAAVEKAGVYLQSYSKMINLAVEEDEVRTVAARLLKIQSESNEVEVIEKNLLKFTVTIKALVNDLDDAALQSIMNDKRSLEELTRKNKELQERYDELNRQMKNYRREFDSANETERVEIKREVARNAEKFSAVDELAKGNEFSLRKDYARALLAYDAAIKLDSQLAEAYNNRGIVKYELGQFSAAVEDYSAALRLKPNYANALNNRGNAHAALNQFQDAANDLQEALRLNKNSAVTHNNLGSVYFSQKIFDAAVNEYSRAIQINPRFAEAFYNRAAAQYALGNYARALEDAQRAAELNPNDSDARALCRKIRSRF